MSTSSFFKDYEEELKANYPGINELVFNRFRQDLSRQHIDFKTTIEDLKNGRPLEYILGVAHFYSIDITVNEHVLIPRFETELLFDLAHKEINKRVNPKVIDIGCGPGTIILALMKEANPFRAFASDISTDAIELAQFNHNKLEEQLKTKDLSFFKSDRFSNIEGDFDIIVSNPPYIKKMSDAKGVHKSVKEFEPEIALYIADSEYDDWFELFFTQAFEHLTIDGCFIIESHEDHLESQRQIATNVGFSNVEILKDLSGRNRFLKMEK